MFTPRTWLAVSAIALGAFFATGAAPAGAATTTVSGTVRSAGGLNTRTAPTASAPTAGKVANKSTVKISCEVTGQTVSGTVRKTNQWDRLTNGRYVSHAYIVIKANIAACPAPPPPPPTVPGPTATMTNAGFIAASVAPAQQGFRQFGVPASVTIAQAILESGWGRSSLSANDNNLFGIKCFNGSAGPIATGCHTYNTSECTPACHPTTASFRTYAGTGDSFADHGSFLVANSRYRPAFAYSDDPDNFLQQMWQAGYATSPTYVTNVKAIMAQYNLYQYDAH
jgi:flagellar protein FlgJ